MDVTSYDHGTPSWIDMSAPDPQAAKAFYTSLFGWDAEDQFDPEGNYIYTMLRKDSKDVCGLGGQMSEEMAGMPAVWNSYVNVDDIQQITKAVESAGGNVLVPPMDVMDAGKMAVFMDPAGAAFCAWQAGQHIGSQVINEPDTYTWNELMSRDVDTAKAFYTEVFGWQYDTMDMPSGPYTVVRGGENGGLGGLMAMPEDVPEEVPSHWAVYFNVADAEATIAKAQELGGTVMFGPQDVPDVGVIGTIADPQGGSFSVMQPPVGT